MGAPANAHHGRHRLVGVHYRLDLRPSAVNARVNKAFTRRGMQTRDMVAIQVNHRHVRRRSRSCARTNRECRGLINTWSVPGMRALQ